MADIRGVRGVQPPDLSVSEVRQVPKSKPTEKVTDQVQISGHAARIAEVIEFSELARTSADIRPEVVELARKRIESGEYFSEEATEKIALKILESLDS